MKSAKAIHPELLDDIKRLDVRKTGIASARHQLIAKGWERDVADKALWHMGFKDKRSSYLMSRLKTGLVVFIVVGGLAAIIGGSLYVERYYKKNGLNPADENKAAVDVGSVGGTITSDVAGITFSFPEDWELKDKPDGTPDLYNWQVEPLTNRAARESMALKYKEQSESGGLDTSSLALLAGNGGDPVYAITFTVYKPPTYTIETTIEQWEEAIKKQQAGNGYTVESFEKVSIDGREGVSFISRVQLGQINLATKGFVFLLGDRRVEITMFPAVSDRSAELERIVSSLRIR